MIEFKAECGHMVRVKDDQAGDVIRCSYCGRRAAVPDTEEENLGALLDGFESPQAAPGAPGQRKRSAKRLLPWRRSAWKKYNPFGTILRLAYAALLIIIIALVVRLYVGDTSDILRWIQGASTGASGGQTDVVPPPIDRDLPKVGLIVAGRRTGLYVDSTPWGAMVWVIERSKAPNRGRIHEVSGVTTSRAEGQFLRLSTGSYVVDVALPWNDPALNDPNLPYFERYWEFRRAIEEASDGERIRLMEEYFVPDDAWPVFVDQTEEQIYLVRQYRNVQVRNDRAVGVRALFLPRIVLAGGEGFSVAELVTSYLPPSRAYTFDEAHTRNELLYYGVPEADQDSIVEALSRIGVIPYLTPGGRTRLFKIGIGDGVFTTKVIREATE